MGTSKTPHGPSLNTEDATGFAEDRQKSSKVGLCFIDSWSSNFLPWNHLKVGIPQMLMPPRKKSDRNFLKPIFLLWKVWPGKNQKKSPTQPEFQEIHYHSYRFRNWEIIRKKIWLPSLPLYSVVKTIAARSLQNGLKKTSKMQWKSCLVIPQTENSNPCPIQKSPYLLYLSRNRINLNFLPFVGVFRNSIASGSDR